MTTGTTSRARFLAACSGEPTLPVPVWLMRQAGRYLEEYRRLRADCDFLQLCKTPALAVEATMQPLRRFALDAAILFSDIMLPVEPLGLRLTYDPGPVIDPPLSDKATVDRLGDPGPGEGLEFVYEAMRQARVALGEERALIGFAGAPVTLAQYMCEGRGAHPFTRFASLAHSDPKAAHALLERLARVVTDHLRLQIDAGADAVQLFDTWAGLLTPPDFDEFVVPHARTIVTELSTTGVPVIYFCRDTDKVLPRLPALGAPVYGIDWHIDIGEAREVLAPAALQGNLDPSLLLGDPAIMIEEARRILGATAGAGHIFNLGHGVHRDTPPDHVHELVEAVRAWTGDAGPPRAS